MPILLIGIRAIAALLFLLNGLLSFEIFQFLRTCNEQFLNILSMNETYQGNHQQHDKDSILNVIEYYLFAIAVLDFLWTDRFRKNYIILHF